MKKFLKFCVFSVIFSFVLCFIGLYVVLNSEKLFAQFIRQDINKKHDGVLTGLKIGHQSFSISGEAYFQDVHFTETYEDYSVSGRIKHIKISHLESLWGGSDRLIFDIEGLSFSETDQIDLKGGEFSGDIIFQNKSFPNIEGQFSAEELNIYDCLMSDVNMHVSVGRDQIDIDDVGFELYGGHVDGQMTVMNETGFPFAVHWNFSDVNLELLGQDQQYVGENVRGHYQGDLQFEGKGNHLTSVFAHIDATQQGAIRTSVVKKLFELINYAGLDSITASLLQNNLKVAENKGRFVGFETLKIDVETLSEDKVSYTLDIGSKQLTLDTHLRLDVPDVSIEEGMKGLYKIIGQGLGL